MQTNKKIQQTCPVCNRNRLLTIHHILPRYIVREIKTDEKRHFVNGENSYWLCFRCHRKYERKANILRKKLLKEFNYPIHCESPVIQVKELIKIKNLCRYMTGKFHRNNYNHSIYESYNFVTKFYNRKYMAYDEIESLSAMRDTVDNPDYIKNGCFLLEHISIKELDILYRKDLRDFLKKRSVKKDNLIPEINKYYEI